jgi:hypothetical protein
MGVGRRVLESGKKESEGRIGEDRTMENERELWEGRFTRLGRFSWALGGREFPNVFLWAIYFFNDKKIID